MQRSNELGDALKKAAVAGDTTVSPPTNVSVASFQSALASQQSPAAAFSQGGLQHYVITAPIQSMPTTAAATTTAAAAVAPPNRQAADMLGASSLTPAQNLQQPTTSQQQQHQQAVVVTQGGSLTATHSALSVQDANTIQQVLSLAASSAAGLQQQQQSLTGSTIHHHGQQLQISATSAGIPPLSVCVTNHHRLQQTPQLGFSMNLPTTQRVAQRHPSGPAQGITVPLTVSNASGAASSGTCSSLEITPVLTTSSGSFPLTVSSVLSTGVQPPRKRIKLEEKPPNTPEIAAYRKKILDHKRKQKSEIKKKYKEHWTERYFLKNNGNIMDFFHWKKRPTPQLIQLLKDANLDSDDEDGIATEPKSEPGIKNTGNVGNILSSPSLPTSVATTLTPTLAALTQQDEKLDKYPDKVNCSSGSGHRSGGSSSSLATALLPPPSSTSASTNHLNALADGSSSRTSASTVASATVTTTGSSHRHATRASLVGGGHSLQGVLRPQQTMLASVAGVSKKPRKRTNTKLSPAAQIKQIKGGCVDLETPNSIIGNQNLKDLINKNTFQLLPADCQYQLIQLLPKCDRLVEGSGISGTALNHEFFTKACEEWPERLAGGEFTPEYQQRLKQQEEKEEKKMDPWKMKHFEQVWGQRSTASDQNEDEESQPFPTREECEKE